MVKLNVTSQSQRSNGQAKRRITKLKIEWREAEDRMVKLNVTSRSQRSNGQAKRRITKLKIE